MWTLSQGYHLHRPRRKKITIQVSHLIIIITCLGIKADQDVNESDW